MSNLRVARRYARALMMTTEQRKTVESVAKDLALIGTTLHGSRDLRLMMASPVVSPPKKTAVFNELFGKRVSADTLEFVRFLISKGREGLLPEVIEQYKAILDDSLGVVAVTVKSATELTTQQEKELQLQMERYTKKKVRVVISIDKAIKGGLVVKIGDTVLDASIRHQLEILRQRFVAGSAMLN
jgi:F-type H+-transporting ATPase subunit delta